jgi:hypothetical protein
VRAKVKIPFGKLEEYKKYVSEYINRIKEKDSATLQFDWFISSDKTEVEILEVYASSEAALKHQEYLGELQGILILLLIPTSEHLMTLIFWPNERYRKSNFTLGFQVQLVLLDYSMIAANLHSTLQEE